MTVERWRMQSGRVASIDLTSHPDAVQGARELLRMNGAALINEESPGVQAEGSEITSTPSKEHDMTDTTVAAPLRPIYGPNDARWHELVAWFEQNATRLLDEHGNPTATLEELMPTERVDWHQAHVLGIERPSPFREYLIPDFPDVPAPVWSTSSDWRGLTVDTEEPMRAFLRDVDARATIEQEATFNPDSGAVRWAEPFLSVWADDSTELRFESAEAALKLAETLRVGAEALRRVTGTRELRRPASVADEFAAREEV